MTPGTGGVLNDTWTVMPLTPSMMLTTGHIIRGIPTSGFPCRYPSPIRTSHMMDRRTTIRITGITTGGIPIIISGTEDGDEMQRKGYPSTMPFSSHINQLPESDRNEWVFWKIAKCSSSSCIMHRKKAFSAGSVVSAAALR